MKKKIIHLYLRVDKKFKNCKFCQCLKKFIFSFELEKKNQIKTAFSNKNAHKT